MSMRRQPALAVGLVVVVLLAGCVREEPALPDADGDELPDVQERAGWNVTVFYEAAPCPPAEGFERNGTTYHVTSNVYIDDNDTDGLVDWQEFTIRTDPNKNDTDGDGLTDKEEWDLRGERDRFFRSSVLSGADVDSDADCLTDLEEVRIGFHVEKLGRTAHSDPTDPDGDRDAWSDWDEINVHGTDPLAADTDGDGANDPLDLDPHRDMAVAFRVLEVRVDAEGVDRVAFVASVAGQDFESDPFSTSQGAWSEAPDGVVSLPVDVDDLAASRTFDLTVTWLRVNEAGEFAGFLNLSPADESTARLQVHAANETWRVFEGSAYSEPGHRCELEGRDGAFRFDMRLGAAGDDPATWPALCGT